MLWLLKNAKVWFWEEGYHGEEIFSQELFDIKLNYIHLNPVRAELVEKEEEYINSSCEEIYGIRKGLLELVVQRIANPHYLYIRHALQNMSKSKYSTSS